MKFSRVLCLAVAVAFVFSFGSAFSEPGKKILKLGLHVSGMGRLDPHFAAGSQDRAAADMMFNGLLRYVPGHAPSIEPDLAESMPNFQIKNGKQIWTIALKKGVMFHPGPKTPAYEMTADDVVFSFNKASDKNRCAYSGDYVGMDIKKTGRYGIQIIIDNPISPALFFPKIANYNGGFIVSQKAIEAMGYEAFKKHPIGTGPFKFDSYEKDKPLKLSAHPAYFRGRPLLDGVQILFYPDTENRLKALIAKKVDVISGSSEVGWLTRVKKMNQYKIDIHGVGEPAMLHFNTTLKPLDNPDVRKAIAYAIDRDAFLKITDPELSGPVYSPVPAPFLPGGMTEKEIKNLGLDYSWNLKKAKALLEKAGYPNGFSLDLVASEKRIYQVYYNALKAQLAKVNINCHIKTVTHRQMHAIIRQDPKPLVIYPAWRPNADAYLTRFFHSDSIIVTGPKPDTNFSHYDRIDDLIESARTQTDPDIQIRLWMQAQIKILNDMAALPLIYTKQLFIRQPYVDYGHTPVVTMALYPQITEKTNLTIE